jgi:hypothetical protein
MEGLAKALHNSDGVAKFVALLSFAFISSVIGALLTSFLCCHIFSNWLFLYVGLYQAVFGHN